jgi:hypothetical protein
MVAALRSEIAAWKTATARLARDEDAISPSSDRRERLRALGYVH